MSPTGMTHINSTTGNLRIFLLNFLYPSGIPTSTEKDCPLKDVANRKSYHLSAFTPDMLHDLL